MEIPNRKLSDRVSKNTKNKGKEKGVMGKKTVIAALLLSLLMTVGALFAQGGSGSAWQYCNAFNVVEPVGTPGGPDYGDEIPSWYTTDYSTVTSFTPVSTWRRGSYELDPVTGEEVPVRMSHDNVVLRLDLLSGTENVELRGVKVTMFGSRDFDPNEDLAPIHPDSTAEHYGIDVTAADTLTGVQFYIDKGTSAMSDVDILDRVDILGIAEQLTIDDIVQPRDTYDPSSPSHTADTLPAAHLWDLDSTATNGWKWWSTTLYFEDAIAIPYEGTFRADLYGLPHYRIWVALQMAGCHECGEGIGGIEGISNSDSFYVMIADREDLIVYRYNPPYIDLVDMTSALTDVHMDNPVPAPVDASRWSRSEMIKGWDEIPPYIQQLWPRNLVSTNGWYSDHVPCDELTDSIYTADEEQPISVTTQDLGTCVDSAFMEIRYINDEFYGTSPGSQFPARIDSIIWRNPLEFAFNDTNSGNALGWEWQYKHSWRFSGGGPWSTTGWTTMSSSHSEAFATWIHPACGTDSFVVMVGNDSTMNRLPMFIDGAYVQVLFRTFSRTNNRRYDYGSVFSPGVVNDTIWTFKVDLSGPNAELVCPSAEGHDNETMEFAGANVRRDYIEGQWIYWRWLADSLPTLLLDVYDDYHAVHDISNHGINTYPGGVGGSGINWRDFEITFAIEHCDGSWDTITVDQGDLEYGVWVDEEENGHDARMWINFEELVLYHPGWAGIVPFQSGDFVHVLLTRLLDDPDYGQRWEECMLGDWDLVPPYWNQIAWVIDTIPSYSSTWGIAGGADGNYGTRNTQDNHVPVMWEVVGVCDYYEEFAYDTLGILRIDLEGPTAPDTFYYPPHQWVTSDTFQIITLNIYDQIGCDMYDLDVEDELYQRVSGVYSGSVDEEARICVNLKVRGCDGSWHPYYHTGAGSIPDGRNFCVGEPDAVGLNLTKKFGEWGVRVTWDPYRTDTDQAHFRPGDKVCVTVYAWDNAITNCQSEPGTAGPVTGWDDDNDPWTSHRDSVNYSIYCSDGSLAHFVDATVPSRNSGYDRLDPDYLYYEISNIARWTFFVDTHAPIFTGENMSQVCNDTMYLYFHDVSANVHGMYCDEWIANIGIQHTELVEGADILLIFTDTMTTPGVTYVDTIIFQNMKLSGGAYPLDVHVAYHDIPGREYQYYYAELIKDPDDDRGAYIMLYGDGSEATCHFFQPYDHVEWELYAGDSPDVPWYPASQRTVSGGRTYRWHHNLDSWSNPGTWFMSWRYGSHDYTGLNVDTLDWPTFWEDTTYDDFENPNWDLIQVDELQIFPQTWLSNVSWFNDEAYNAFMYTTGAYNYPPDLTGDYTNIWHAWMGRYLNLDPPGMEPELQWEEGDSSVVSPMESRDPYVNFWVNDLNFLVADIYTCTDSIIWECLVGTDPDEDTLPFRVPHVVIDLFDADGEHVWTVDEYYDCHCSPCFISYYPSRTACVDWGRMHVGPIDQTEEWKYTIRRIDTLETDPELVTDTIVGWQHLDSISVRLEFNVREPNDFSSGDRFTKYVFRWDYVVDMAPPTAVFRDPDATTGYNEVNCHLIHDSNHTIRLRLENIVDNHVGCAPGTLAAPGWSSQWPIPAVAPSSDWVKFEYETTPPVPAEMVWNPATHYLWSNESFVITNCALEHEVADTMTIGTPGIEIYHGLDRSGGGFPVPVETHLDRDTIFIADSVYAEAIIQDRLGNWALKTSRKVGLDNGLPEVKGFALSTMDIEVIGTDSLGDPIYGDPYLNNWDDELFKLPWMVPDQDSIVGIYNFSDVCTVYVRLWFNDNMDMREADHLYGHIVRFQPRGWTHWFPVLPVETVGGGPGGLHYPLAQRYVDYRDIAGVMPSARPDGRSDEDSSPTLPGGVEALDHGWNSDREWIGYMVIAGAGAMDGVGKLRVQGFDDNAGNYMLPIEYPLRIVTGDPEYSMIYWPRIDDLNTSHVDPWSGEPDDALVLSGWSTSDPVLADSTRCSFYEDEDRMLPITAYWDNELAESDSVRFRVFWQADPWDGTEDLSTGHTFFWTEDDMWSDNIFVYNDTSWVVLPVEDLDLLHEYFTTLGGAPVSYSNNEMYATIVFEAFSRFRPTNPYITDVLWNVRIDNRRPDPQLTSLTGGQMTHGNHTVLPFGSTDLKVCWQNNQVEQLDKMSIWLHSLIDGTDYMLYPEMGVPGMDFDNVEATAPLYYDPINEVLCLEYNNPSGLPAGMWTLSWKAFDGIQVVDTASGGVIERYWQYYHTDCEFDFFTDDTLTILRPPFLARGDNLYDALKTVSENYPAVIGSDDIFPWWDAAMEDMWPDWPTWGWIDTAGIRAAGLPDLWRIDSLRRVPQMLPVVQITTFNNPDYSSGDPDPLMHPYVESGGYIGDSIYVLLEVLPTDINVAYIDLNISDYWGGNISGSNLELNVRLDSTDVVMHGDRMYWVYKWDVDDMDNRYDGLVTLTASEYTYSPSTDTWNYWDHIAYILLDTDDPVYEVSMLRVDDATVPHIAINPIDYPDEEYIWVVNSDEFAINVDWDGTIFDPAEPGAPTGYYNYADYIYTRSWDNWRISIDGGPNYGTYSDANDHLEARLWDDDLDVWDIHHPFWRQPDFMNSAMTPSSYDDAEPMFPFGTQLEFFADDVYTYSWDVAGAPEGLLAQGVAYILGKSRDAAGNVLDYEEARISKAKGKIALVDIEAPTIDSSLVIATGENFTAYVDAIWDNFIEDNFTNELGDGYVYVMITIEDSIEVGPFWVDPTGAVATSPWGAYGPTPGDVVDVCVYDLAGNATCIEVDVVPEVHACTYELCTDWNLIAISVDPETLTTAVFGGAPVYKMIGGTYVPYTGLLEPGAGYAVYPPTAMDVTVSGAPVTSFEVALEAGWNLIGATWEDVPFTAPDTDPAGAIDPSQTRWYECGVNYHYTSVLEHCRGHLVMVTNPAGCDLTVPGARGGKVVYTVKDGQFDPLFTGRLVTDTRTLTFGAADIATSNFDRGIDSYAIPAHVGQSEFVLDGGYDVDYRNTDSKIEWTVNATSSYSATFEAEGDWVVSLDGIELSDGDVIEIAPGSHKLVADRVAIPEVFALGQNLPNPFNAATAIKYELPTNTRVSLEVYSVLGQKVATLVNGDQEAGYRTVVWDGNDDEGRPVPSGIYFYKISAGDFSATRKMTLMK